MKLLDLPIDIINILPQYFSSIYDLYSVLLTCSILYNAYRDTAIRLPPILPKLDGQPLFSPHPHLLLSSVARQIGDWAVLSPSHRYELYQVLLNGYDGLLSLAERVTLVSLSDLRNLYGTKYTLLSPLTRLVDFEAGPAMVRYQEMDPAEYGLTICLQPDIAVLNYVVYCELFHHYVDNILASSASCVSENKVDERDQFRDEMPNALTKWSVCDSAISQPRPLEAGIRHRFIAYCLPDPNNHRNRNYKTLGTAGRDEEWQLLDFVQMSRSTAFDRRDEALKRYWVTGVLQAIPEDEDLRLGGRIWNSHPAGSEKRSNLFCIVVTHLGYESLQMLLLDGLNGERIKARVNEIREKVQAIPKVLIDEWEYFGSLQNPASDVPADEEWHAWLGMKSDCYEGIGTNQKSEEDLQTEEEACESLLKLGITSEQLDIAESVAA